MVLTLHTPKGTKQRSLPFYLFCSQDSYAYGVGLSKPATLNFLDIFSQYIFI